jgi:hypothetical protein
LIQRLSIVSSLRDLDQPLLYQLLETPGNNNTEKGTTLHKIQDAHHQSESKPLTAVSKPYQQEHPTIVSPPSSAAAVKSTVVHNDKSYPENDYKQRAALPHGTSFQKFHEEVPSVAMGDTDYDSNDDSIADEKKTSKYSNDTKDHKNGQDAKKNNDIQAKHSDDSDASRNNDSFGDDKSVEFPEEDIEEDALEVGADSESSASFSLEYGYVEDPKAAETEGTKNQKISKASVQEVKANNQSSALKSSNILSGDSKERAVDLTSDTSTNGATVGIQKLAQVGYYI